MKRLLAVTALGGALITGSLGLAGTASADVPRYYPSGSKGDQSVVAYYNDVASTGLGGTYSSASNLGAMVCGQLNHGASEDSLIATAMTTPDTNVTKYQAKVLVWSAEWHFCPNYY
jgi:hypothetical protein